MMSGPAPLYTLFVAPNTCARVPTTALEEIGLPFQTRLVRFMRGDNKAADYLGVNPKGKVPVLLVADEPLTENVAILRYLARAHPEAQLLPPAPGELDDARQIADLSFCSATLHPIVTRMRIPLFFADSPQAQGEVWEKANEAMAVQLRIVEERLGQRDWWYGARWSVVDSYVNWCWFRVTGAGFDPSGFPRLRDHAARLERRPAVERALARERLDAATLQAEGLTFTPPPPPIRPRQAAAH